jgi:hypothetical protein
MTCSHQGPIRDQLGVVTRAFFAQRDFSKTEILEELYDSLIESLRVKADETALLMSKCSDGRADIRNGSAWVGPQVSPSDTGPTQDAHATKQGTLFDQDWP